MEFVLSWVKNGLVFGLFASVILMLSPGKTYRAHIAMATGLLFIMVMLHPLMELLQIDTASYAEYIQDYLMLEPEVGRYERENLRLYEESVAIEVKMALKAQGYEVSEVGVTADASGRTLCVRIRFGAGSELPGDPERELAGLLGEGARITYEVAAGQSRPEDQ